MANFLALQMGPITPTPPGATQLTAPTISVTANSAGSTLTNTVSWGASTGAVGFEVQKSVVATALTTPTDWTFDDQDFGSGTFSWDDVGLSFGVYRVYRVRAKADLADATKLDSDWTVSSVQFVASSSGSARPAMTSFSKNIINRPDVAPYNATGGEQAGAVIFWVNSTGTTSSETAVPGHPGHYYGTWRGARDHAESLPSSTPIIVYAIVSGRINETGFFWWRKSNATINFATAPSPGLFFGQGMQFAVYNCSNVIVKHCDFSMDNNTDVAGMDNRDCLYVGDCGNVVFQNCSFRQSCDEVVDCVDHNNVNYVGFANCFFGPPLCNAGRTGDKYSHGYVGVGGYGSRNALMDECFAPHNNGRAYTLWRGTGFVGNDNVVFNCGYQTGDPQPFSGYVEMGSDRPADPSGATAIFQSHRGNLFIPGQALMTSGARPFTVYNDNGDFGPLNASSRFRITDNYYYDPSGRWTYAQNVNTNFIIQNGTIPGSVITTSAVGLELTGYTVWTLTLNGSNQVTQTDALAKATYVIANAGAWPGDRSAGPDALIASHCLNWINQNGGPYGGPHNGLYNDESELMGNFTVPGPNTIDITSASSWGGDQFPFSDAESLILSSDAQLRSKRSQWTLRRERDKGCLAWGQAA